MPLVTHVFSSHKRIQDGAVVSHDYVLRRANFNYDESGEVVVINIIPTLSPKRAFLSRQVGFTLYYIGEDPDYHFELECWPDNGTIKRLSVYRRDLGVEYQYISNHQDAINF
jgi:hypothetical protein